MGLLGYETQISILLTESFDKGKLNQRLFSHLPNNYNFTAAQMIESNTCNNL